MQIEKTFDELYDNIYKKDIKYFCEKRAKQFKEVYYDSLNIKQCIFLKRKKINLISMKSLKKLKKWSPIKIWSSKWRRLYLFGLIWYRINIKTKGNKNYKINSRQSLMENKVNLKEIVRVIKICKDIDDRINGNY